MHITKKRRDKTGKRQHKKKSHHTKSHHKKSHHTKSHHTKSHHTKSHRRVRSHRIRRRNSDNNGEKLVDDSVSVYNKEKEKDSGNIINGMRDFLHKKSFIM